MGNSPKNCHADTYNISEGIDLNSKELLNDEQLREMLAESKLSSEETQKVIAMKSRFRMVLLGILNARMKGDTETASVLAGTLKMGLGTESSNLGVLKRWFNG